MKALSGFAEWFWLLAKNIKPVENRVWSLYHYLDRKELPLRVYLHASKTKTPATEIKFIRSHLTPQQLTEFDSVDWTIYRGTIIGEVTIIAEIYDAVCGIIAGDYTDIAKSGWYFGPYGFVVEKGILYDKPISYKGQLGFFKVNLPPHAPQV
ncbi:MAG: hypothetical protein PHU23_08730 [Dehalococcoidales bacterium]|nr:hypothetical protein [Dehalococcoidales bacterium]